MNRKNSPAVEKQILGELMEKLLGLNPIELRNAMEKHIIMPSFEGLAFIIGDSVAYYEIMLDNLTEFIKNHYHYNDSFDSALDQFLDFYSNIEENLDVLVAQSNEYLADYILLSVSRTTRDEFINDYHKIKTDILGGEA